MSIVFHLLTLNPNANLILHMGKAAHIAMERMQDDCHRYAGIGELHLRHYFDCPSREHFWSVM